ncbi:trigger factor [Rubidibacter lacunae KORDI 51-2]|uniref:Trigger factor n=1 Tax=Rubidibacter lacunae KORDI 51-2 TaxID=582515 RepID=U5DU09_9CHRO|nr:trigger factor [Rubidibacter lacunae]ERN43165.1 trigger factor [Rubidibacter lacunae KORDI 51-2]
MKVTQEKLANSQVGLGIEVSADDTKKAYEKVVSNIARSANIPGFRKGKVPRQVLLQRMGRQRIKAAAIEELMSDKLEKAVREADIKALGDPQLRQSPEELTSRFEPGQPFAFGVAVDVSPEIDLGGSYEKLSIRAEKYELDAKDVELHIERLRKEAATLVPVEDRPAAMDDSVEIDFAGRFPDAADDSPPIEGTEASGYECTIAAGQMVEGLLEGVVGMQPGETKQIPVTFPTPYPREDLQGKDVVFTVALKELKVLELPELDDDFVQEATNDDFDTLAAWQEFLSADFAEQAETNTKDGVRARLLDALVEQLHVDLPQTLIEEELKTLLTQSAMQLAQMGMDIRQLFNEQSLPAMRDRARPDAEKRLRGTLALEALADREGLEPTQEAIEEKLKDVLAEFESQNGRSASEVEQEQIQGAVRMTIARELALDWLEERAEIEYVPQGTFEAEAAEDEESDQGTESVEVVADASAASSTGDGAAEDAPTAEPNP